MWKAVKENPVRVVTWGLGVVTATLALLAAFGVSISSDQSAAIVGEFTALTAILVAGGEVVRAKVTPTSKLGS